MTSAQCIDHPYFHETLLHLQRTAPIPRIPFSQGQPVRSAAAQQPDLNVPPRQIPPSHSHRDALPAFANGDMRTLPPPVHTPDIARAYYPAPHPESLHRLPEGASALVHQLRELDLPTEDLASYGNRPPPSPVASSVYEMGGDQTTGHQPIPRYTDRLRQVSNYQSSFDGSVFESAEPAAAGNSSISNSNLSVSNLHLAERSRSVPVKSHVAAFVQQQQKQMEFENGTSRIVGEPSAPMPPPIEPTTGAAAHRLAQTTTGKKKKWGLSSVFGGGDRSVNSLTPVEEVGYQASASSLKRTQSGTQSVEPPAAIEDPKKAKKEAVRAARELEKAKREAADRAQRERSRAVMQKRDQLIEARRRTNTKSEIEFGGTLNEVPEIPKAVVPAPQQPVYASASLHQQTASREYRGYPTMPGSVSAQSVRSHESHRSGLSVHSVHSQSQPILSAAALEQQGGVLDAAGRHKARRRNEDDDHSMSSFDRNSLRSRSVLTVGTIDSE